MAAKNGGKPAPAPAKEERQKPAYECRLGRIKATVWENHHEKTGRWFSVTITRSYKDGQGQWKSASSFGLDDLLVVAEVSRLAYLWIHQQKTSGKGSDESSGEGAGTDDVPF